MSEPQAPRRRSTTGSGGSRRGASALSGRTPSGRDPRPSDRRRGSASRSACAFRVCFVTGLLSHLIQHPPGWFTWPSRPAWLYRVTQGVHVATGIASIPLLLAKLWVVYPRFWTWPPFRSAGHLVERITLLPLVGGSLFMLFTGIGSISRLRPWDFSFPAAHYSAAWITIGALVAHVGAKLHVAARALARGVVEPSLRRLRRDDAACGFLGAAAAAAGAVTVATVGQTVRPLAAVSVLAPRDPRVGPQGVPVNRTARSAGVTEASTDARLPPARRGQRADAARAHARGAAGATAAGGRAADHVRGRLERDGDLAGGAGARAPRDGRRSRRRGGATVVSLQAPGLGVRELRSGAPRTQPIPTRSSRSS